MSTIRQKHPDEVRYYPFDFSRAEEVRWDSETLTGTPTVVEVEGDGALTIGSPAISGSKVKALLSAGTNGITYILRCRAQTSGGATLTIKGKLHVGEDADLA